MPKDQTFCPKCGRMYCEGYWGEGVCTADMHFSSDPTSRGDEVSDYVRQWYEIHRESWWDRHRPSADRKGLHADNFMLGFLNEVTRVEAEVRRQMAPERSAAIQAVRPPLTPQDA